ncbi:unnamed protein product [Withania somnifera]
MTSCGIFVDSIVSKMCFPLGKHIKFVKFGLGFNSPQATSAPTTHCIGGKVVSPLNRALRAGNEIDIKDFHDMSRLSLVTTFVDNSIFTAISFVVCSDFGGNIVVVETVNKTVGSNLLDGLPKERVGANRTGVVDLAKKNQSTDVGDSINRKQSTDVGAMPAATENNEGTDEVLKLCELKFGSLLFMAKMKDLYVARAYYPSITKLPALEKLSHEMKQNIQDFERVLSVTTVDKDLPPLIDQKLSKMEAVIAQAKACHVDCSNVDKKFRQLVDLTENEATFHMRQKYFRYPPPDIDQSLAERHLNPNLHHFVIFSSNVLASSAVINSTVTHAKESENQVFHVVTDRLNYFAMKLWFSRSKYMEAAVEVLNIEDHKLENNKASKSIHLSLPEEYRISFHKVDEPPTTEYLSIFSHSHYLLPEIFPSLKKVIVLDDDIIVQRDLSVLWDIDIDGKVNGAVQCCSVKLIQLRNFFADKKLDETSCAWMSGLNVIDLVRWREQDISGRCPKLVTQMNSEEAVALRASMLTFQGEVYTLDDKWVLYGLGYKYGVDIEAVKNARVLHFNGNMKPWLDLGIHDYTVSWGKFLSQENQFLSDCNNN